MLERQDGTIRDLTILGTYSMLIGVSLLLPHSCLTAYLAEAYRTFLEVNFYHSYRFVPIIITEGHDNDLTGASVLAGDENHNSITTKIQIWSHRSLKSRQEDEEGNAL